MKSMALMVAACAAAWTAAPAAAAVRVTFTAIGSAVETGEYSYETRSFPAFAVGSFAIDPVAGTYAADYAGPGFAFVPITLNARINGDALTIAYDQPRYSAGAESYTLVLNFTAGYLQSGFPATFDSSQFTGGSFTYASSICGPICVLGTTFSGTLNSAFFADAGTIARPSANASVIPGVPEPATWLSMIAGFGAIGWATRARPQLTRRVRIG